MHTVSLTFDVDAETGLEPALSEYHGRLSSLSEREYGVRRALPRLLEMLGERGLRATFYVPGATAQRHPEAVAAIAAAGHEVGHHGHRHLRSHEIDAARQAAEIDEALEALRPQLGPAFGYRSPAWELTPVTAALLVERGFAFDSSLIGDDRPYFVDVGGRPLLELPIHWSLDDWPWFGMGFGTLPTETGAWREAWSDEVACARREDRPVTLTFHPEVIGRGYRALALERLLDDLAAGGSEVVTHAELAARISASPTA